MSSNHDPKSSVMRHPDTPEDHAHCSSGARCSLELRSMRTGRMRAVRLMHSARILAGVIMLSLSPALGPTDQVDR